MRISAVVLALPLLIGLSGSSSADGFDSNRMEQLPLNPGDEVLQTTANVSAYLMCSCLFVEKAAEAACRADQKSDLMSQDRGFVISSDLSKSMVRVSNGRWTGIARFLGAGRGCRLD